MRTFFRASFYNQEPYKSKRKKKAKKHLTKSKSKIMAKEYDDTNTFRLFKEDVDPESKKPGFTGIINIGGKEMRLAAWVKKSQGGRTWLSGQVSELQKKTAEPVTEESPF